MVGRSRSRFYRFSALLLAALPIVGCSGQPMTLDQEFAAAAVAGAIGAGGGALVAHEGNQTYPEAILIGAAGLAGVVLLYEEVKREAAMPSAPNAGPGTPASTSPLNQNP